MSLPFVISSTLAMSAMKARKQRKFICYAKYVWKNTTYWKPRVGMNFALNIISNPTAISIIKVKNVIKKYI